VATSQSAKYAPLKDKGRAGARQPYRVVAAPCSMLVR